MFTVSVGTGNTKKPTDDMIVPVTLLIFAVCCLPFSIISRIFLTVLDDKWSCAFVIRFYVFSSYFLSSVIDGSLMSGEPFFIKFSLSFSALELFTYERNQLKLSDLKWVEHKNVNQSPYWSGETLRVSGVWGSQISKRSAHESGKFVSPTHRQLLPLRKYFWYTLV
jgi:hypothetical protein